MKCLLTCVTSVLLTFGCVEAWFWKTKVDKILQTIPQMKKDIQYNESWGLEIARWHNDLSGDVLDALGKDHWGEE